MWMFEDQLDEWLAMVERDRADRRGAPPDEPDMARNELAEKLRGR